MGFLGGTSGKEPTLKTLSANGGDIRYAGLIPGLGRSPGGMHGNPLQYSCLENSMDREAWWASVHRLRRVCHDWRDLAHTWSTQQVLCYSNSGKLIYSVFFFCDCLKKHNTIIFQCLNIELKCMIKLAQERGNKYNLYSYMVLKYYGTHSKLW